MRIKCYFRICSESVSVAHVGECEADTDDQFLQWSPTSPGETATQACHQGQLLDIRNEFVVFAKKLNQH